MKKHWLFLLLILVICMFCMKALFHPGLFTAHDIWHQVARLYWYGESTQNGVFPPRWIAPMAGGLGYPLFVFSYHFPWMIGLPFLFLGFSVATVIKILFIGSFLISGWGMYWCSYLFTKNGFASFVSSVLYVVAPWRFVTIFVSAAMGRAFVFALFPLLVVSVYYMAKSKRGLLPVVGLGVSLSALILSHLISIFTVAAILVPFVIYLKPSFKKLFSSILITACLTAWYVFPILTLSKLIQVSQGQFKSLYLSQFVDFKQLLYSPWGYGIVMQNAKEGPFSYQLGISQWSVIILSLALTFRLKRKNLLILLLLAFFTCIFLMLEISKPLWNMASHIATFDYPTMFLIPAVFIASFLAGLLIMNGKRLGTFVGVALILIAFVNNRNYMRVNQYVDSSVSEIVTSEITTNSFNEYLPLTANAELLNKDIADVQGIGGTVRSQTVRMATSFNSSFDISNGQWITLKIFSFPGLQVLLDNHTVSYRTTDQGLIQLFVDAGAHTLSVSYPK